MCDDKENEANEECSAVYQSAFMSCHEQVHPSRYFKSCVYDHCATGGDTAMLCESVESYVVACQFAGVELVNWWMETACGEY